MAAASVVDAEALYYLARSYAKLGEHDRAAAELQRVVSGGFWCADTFVRDPWLKAIRGRDDVSRAIEIARTAASSAFEAASGRQLVGAQ